MYYNIGINYLSTVLAIVLLKKKQIPVVSMGFFRWMAYPIAKAINSTITHITTATTVDGDVVSSETYKDISCSMGKIQENFVQ